MTDTEASEAAGGQGVAPAPEKKVGNLAARFLVALVAVPILVLAIYQDVHHAIWWAMIYAASLIALHELLSMSMDDRPSIRAGLVIGAVIAAGFYWLPWAKYQTPLLTMLAAFTLPALYFLFSPGDMTTAARRLAVTTFGIIYAAILPAFLALLKQRPEIGPDLIILVLASAWLSDTGGYFAGKGIGGPKLYPLVSPNKTWAGSIGGVVVAAIGGVVIKLTLLDELSWFHVMMLIVPSAIIGQIGDLAESLIKRSNGVKDSGALLPGHGGILDRIDAVLFIAPYVALYAMLAL
jgi:phosphatidate cytidylyltransferase